jgi:hypothetical protein
VDQAIDYLLQVLEMGFPLSLDPHLNGKLQFPPASLLNLFDQTSLLTTFRGFPFVGTLLHLALLDLFGNAQFFEVTALYRLGEAQLFLPLDSLLLALPPSRSRRASRLGDELQIGLIEGYVRTFLVEPGRAYLRGHIPHGFGDDQFVCSFIIHDGHSSGSYP